MQVSVWCCFKGETMSIKRIKKEQFTLSRVLQFVYDKFTEFETHVKLTKEDVRRGREALKELEYVALKSVGRNGQTYGR